MRTDRTYETNGTNEVWEHKPIDPISRIRQRSTGFHNAQTVRRPTVALLAPRF
jgi:hypothetical protein